MVGALGAGQFRGGDGWGEAQGVEEVAEPRAFAEGAYSPPDTDSTSAVPALPAACFRASVWALIAVTFSATALSLSKMVPSCSARTSADAGSNAPAYLAVRSMVVEIRANSSYWPVLRAAVTMRSGPSLVTASKSGSKGCRPWVGRRT